MSMTRTAIRIAAVEALKAGGTLVGDNVLDSQISVFDLTADGQLRSDQQRPFIAVYTDAAQADLGGHTGLRGNGSLDILFNYGVSMTMAQTDRETGQADIVEGYPATDSTFEAVLDVLDVQISRALVDPDNAWAQVFGDFVARYKTRKVVRSSSAAENVRLAAGQTRLSVEVFADPQHGQPLADGGPWPRFMALLAQHDMPQLPLFEMLLGDATTGLYAEFERLTAMTLRDTSALTLYDYAGVGRDVVVTEPSSEGVPQT